MNEVRWGILSTGKIARAFAEALRDTPGAVLAGVGSRTVASAQAFSAEFGGTPYGSYEELAAAPDIDAIYIGTPHTLHASNALLALGGGKAVLCEKPFTINRREAAQVVALARERKLFLMEAMWTRFLPAFEEAKRILDSGGIGVPRQVVADFGFFASVAPEHRLVNPELGGGALLDLGIYPLSAAAYLLGPVESVSAQAVMQPNGVDAQTAFTLKHTGGGLSICNASMRARTPVELVVSGDRGYLRLNSRFHRAPSITVDTEAGGSRTIDTPYLGNGYVHEIMEVQRCLGAGLLESPRMPLDETVALMGVLDDIRSQIGLRYPAD
ncbi:Gfo/Idh/MocA family protein [Pseudoduganella sp. GCM10020061]|uniref:Gfo/Idh/MocA family protein n=1 Tax=Pseudoduganella sp. GCM10020061 TaxID=3317345 RepID=UPI003635E58F